jgi:hypothetical protein
LPPFIPNWAISMGVFDGSIRRSNLIPSRFNGGGCHHGSNESGRTPDSGAILQKMNLA